MPEVIEWGSGGTPKATVKEYYENGDIPWLIIGDLNNGIVTKSETKITKLGLDNSSAKMIPPNTLLVAMYGSIGKLGITGIECCTNQAIAFAKKMHGVTTKYMFYYMAMMKSKLISKGKGGTQKNISQTVLNSLDVIVPPMKEQQRIVTRIEELFSQLDSGVETLKKTKEQLKVYRQAILSEAFPTLSKANKKLLYEIAEISGGITKGRKLSPNDSIELPYLRVANVQNGYLNLSQIKTIQLKKTEREKYLLKFGDVLYTEGGDRDKLGRGTVWKDEVANCVHQNHIFKARINNSLAIPEYIAYWSMAGTAREYFYKNGKQTVNLASINKTVLSNLPIPIVPLELQYKTIKEIESRLSVCDSIEKTIDTALQEAEGLRQSILKQAFEGGV
ncbi:MAG: restriction endonuclease subunit S [Ruminococcus sp.]|nr:restriction endonuclease subunit S [Ruminococcus sp.]